MGKTRFDKKRRSERAR